MLNVVVHLSNITYTGLSEEFEGLSVNAVPKVTGAFYDKRYVMIPRFP